MIPVLKSIHYVSLYVFLGAPVFWYLLRRPPAEKTERAGDEAGRHAAGTRHDSWRPVVTRVLDGGLLIGLASFVVSIALEGLIAGSFGTPVVAKIVLAGASAFFWRRAHRGRGGLWTLGGVASGAFLLVAIALLKDGAANPGLFALLNDVVHLAASIALVGGLLYAAVVGRNPGFTDDDRLAAGLTQRLTVLAFVTIPLIALTGAFSGYVHLYTPLALQKTAYGRTVATKVALFAALLLVAIVGYFAANPAADRKAGFGRTVTFARIKSVVLIGILAATGMLVFISPEGVVAELVHDAWRLQTGGHTVNVDMAAGDVTGELRLDIHIDDAAGGPAPPGTEVVVDMEMPAHSMGLHPLQAERISPGHYRAQPLLSMDGEWETTITADLPDGEKVRASFAFDAFQGARSEGMTRRLDPRAIFFEFRTERAHRASHDDYVFDFGEYVRDFVFSLDERPMQFVSGLFWILAAVYVLVIALRGEFPRWTAPAGMIALGLGAYFLFSSMAVDAYPTTYADNPVPFTARSVDVGQQLYVAHCSVCHGPEAHGDGPLAPYIDPPPEDLRVRHIDAHPDGELYWWFTYGIPGSDMPANETTMTDEERWHVVNFVRSLHREVPGTF